jgi:WD40 repeat protein
MKNLKRSIIVLLLALTLIIVSACGNNGTDATQKTYGTSTTEKVTETETQATQGTAAEETKVEGTEGKETEESMKETEEVFAGEPELVWSAKHSKKLESVAFSPDGKVIATGNRNGTVWLWNVDDGQQLSTLDAPETKWVASIDCHPSGKMLAASPL